VEKTSQSIKSELNGRYIILSDFNNGSAFIEPALKFGLSYSGNSMKKVFAPILSSVYSGNYLWNIRDGFTDWNGSYLASDIFSKNNEIYVYAKTDDCASSTSRISEMTDGVGMTEFVSLKKVYENEKTGEVIVLASVDTAKFKVYNQADLVIETSMEELTSDAINLKSNMGEYTFVGGKQQSHQYARSGISSASLTSSTPFGLNISFPATMAKRYKVEFWQRSSGQNQALAVASADQSNLFYKTSVQSSNKPGEWTRTELNISIPEDYPEPEIRFYLYNPTSDSVWVDDLRILVFK
jgi:hypothetical protein